MSKRVYALLVGINAYSAEVGALQGCINDIDMFHDYLRRDASHGELAVEILKDGEATKENLVRTFRQHLGQARSGDVALFHFSGHGARSCSAGAFAQYYPDRKDEGLVCIDSRSGGKHDLADKELAILIQEVAARGVHVAVTLDCCHSGSGTRNADSYRGLRSRVTHEVFAERPLDSYLDGYYAQLAALGQPLSLPASRHILLAACERTQQAKETPDNCGVFTSTLLDVLEKSGGNLSYAELFMRCRAAVRKRADDQSPQFETYGHFDSWSGFLGRPTGVLKRRYSAVYEGAAWRVECGAIHGMPINTANNASMTLFQEQGELAAGTASVVEVGAQHSVLQPKFAAEPGTRYLAEMDSMPVAPLLMWAEPGSVQATQLQQALVSAGVSIALTDVLEAAPYLILRKERQLLLCGRASTRPHATVAFDEASPGSAMPAMLAVLNHVASWERSIALANAIPGLHSSWIDFFCTDLPGDREPIIYKGPEVVLDSLKQGSGADAEWHGVRIRVCARNLSGKQLHFMLVHFSEGFGVKVLRNDPVPSGEDWITLYGHGLDEFLWVGDDEAESIDRFKLIVSDARVDGFLLEQSELASSTPLTRDRALGSSLKMSINMRGSHWLTRDLLVRTVRRIDQLGTADWVSANGSIAIKGHSQLTASISLGTVQATARGLTGLPFLPAFTRAGLALLSFGNTRGAAESVLELTNIQNGENIQAHPLHIVVNVPLAADEAILPFVFDGEHLLLAGHPKRDEQGKTEITIDHLYDMPSDRRSVGKALKLYFFKTYLKRTNVNSLAWVDYAADGSITRRQDGLAERVAASRRVLLLVHGIIGDTADMASSVRSSGVERYFDLVLTYDYENLATPIDATARRLKADLADVGLDPQASQHLTLLAHSMGGLVSRWFIEREGGDAMVDHLVMCGTPNRGSPFGEVGAARKIITFFAGLAANAAPALLPFCAPLLFLLNRSAKVTPALEQMGTDSDFIHGLNSSPDPGVRYTVLAGDVKNYQDDSDPMFAKLVAKIGRGVLFNLLFEQRPNDIAVSVESIFGIGAERPGFELRPIACHHLNYFSSPPGQAALNSVAW